MARKHHRCDQLALVERRDETDPLSAMARFEGKTPLPFQAPAPRRVLVIIDPSFIDINQLGRIQGSDGLAEDRPLGRIPFAVAVTLFFRVKPIFLRPTRLPTSFYI
jgi:hypothetical protein